MTGKILKKFQYFEKNSYKWVFRVADYKSAIRFEKFKMADSI